jgi:hypothetical protein
LLLIRAHLFLSAKSAVRFSAIFGNFGISGNFVPRHSTSRLCMPAQFRPAPDACASTASKLYSCRSDIAHANIESLTSSGDKLSRDALEFTCRAIHQFLLHCCQMKPLGSSWDGTREDVLNFYRQWQSSYPTEIDTIVVSHNFKDAWKRVRDQS